MRSHDKARKLNPQQRTQPHFHPTSLPLDLDKRGNCPRCVDYNPERYGIQSDGVRTDR